MNDVTRYYAKQNKLERERHIPYDFTYMWNQKKQNKVHTTETNLYNKLIPAGWEGSRGMGRR